MAGFALFMTVLFFGVTGLVLATGTSLLLYLYTRRKLSGRTVTHRRTLYEVIASPFLALLWLVMALLLHVQISNKFAHQDCGFSPAPYVTLPNGYVLGSHNTYDGYFHAPGFETDVPVAGPGYVRSIVDLHMQNGLFTGTQFDFRTSHIRNFTFNIQTHDFQMMDEDKSPACDSQESRCVDKWSVANDRAQTGAASYWKLYKQYRHQWPNYVLTVLVLGGEAVITAWAWKLWQQIQFLA